MRALPSSWPIHLRSLNSFVFFFSFFFPVIDVLDLCYALLVETG